MKFVEPIRDLKKITQIKNQLRWSWKIRDLLLFELWINSALRISDLLKIKVYHLYNDDLQIRDSFVLQESKTKKNNKITITPKVKITLKRLHEMKPKLLQDNDNYIFYNKKSKLIWSEHIWRKQARKMINVWCVGVWLKWSYWGHTLRKTRWYQARLRGVSMPIIQNKLQHSSMSITMRYLGITYEEIEEASNSLDL